MGNIYVTGPNEALIISGGCGSKMKKKIIIGNWVWAWWVFNDIQLLPLELFTLKVSCENVNTLHGVPICITGVVQCKFIRKHEFLQMAAEQFLGLTRSQIRIVLLETIEGHIRVILATLSMEDIYKDLDKFARTIRKEAAADVQRMGIDIISLTIKNVYDPLKYLDSLGRARIAEIKCQTEMDMLLADNDARIFEAECEKLSTNVHIKCKLKMEEGKSNSELERSNFEREVNEQKIETKFAYELQAARIEKQIRAKQKELELIEKRQWTKLQELDIQIKENQLEMDVRLPVDYEVYRITNETLARTDGEILLAEAEAAKIEALAEAEAHRIKVIGTAQAQRMAIRAEALQVYNESAILALYLETLSEMAKELSKPLAKISEIVITSGDTPSTI